MVGVGVVCIMLVLSEVAIQCVYFKQFRKLQNKYLKEGVKQPGFLFSSREQITSSILKESDKVLCSNNSPFCDLTCSQPKT